MADTKSDLWRQMKARGLAEGRDYVTLTIEDMQTILSDQPMKVDITAEYFAPTSEEDIAGAAMPSQIFSNTPDPNELPGMRQNAPDKWEVIRTDDQGRMWLQEEVRKPAAPKPRGRRILRYSDPGTRKTKVVEGSGWSETFEVGGEGPPRELEARITLPSYQVGIYIDPRFREFARVHIYNDSLGFNREDVEEFFGGAELVPPTCKRKYVSSDLCYDMRSVIQTINAQHQELMRQQNRRLPA